MVAPEWTTFLPAQVRLIVPVLASTFCASLVALFCQRSRQHEAYPSLIAASASSSCPFVNQTYIRTRFRTTTLSTIKFDATLAQFSSLIRRWPGRIQDQWCSRVRSNQKECCRRHPCRFTFWPICFILFDGTRLSWQPAGYDVYPCQPGLLSQTLVVFYFKNLL